MLPDHGMIYFLDLDREAEIGIGITWSTDLGPGECILSEDWQRDYNVVVGQRVAYLANYMYVWRTIADVYNYNERDRPNYEPVDELIFDRADPTFIECTVKKFVSTDG